MYVSLTVFALVDEASEWSKSGTWPNHQYGRGDVLRKLEAWFANEHWHCFTRLFITLSIMTLNLSVFIYLLCAKPRRTYTLVMSSCWLLELCYYSSDVNNLWELTMISFEKDRVAYYSYISVFWRWWRDGIESRLHLGSNFQEGIDWDLNRREVVHDEFGEWSVIIPNELVVVELFGKEVYRSITHSTKKKDDETNLLAACRHYWRGSLTSSSPLGLWRKKRETSTPSCEVVKWGLWGTTTLVLSCKDPFQLSFLGRWWLTWWFYSYQIRLVTERRLT